MALESLHHTHLSYISYKHSGFPFHKKNMSASTKNMYG